MVGPGRALVLSTRTFPHAFAAGGSRNARPCLESEQSYGSLYGLNPTNRAICTGCVRVQPNECPGWPARRARHSTHASPRDFAAAAFAEPVACLDSKRS